MNQDLSIMEAEKKTKTKKKNINKTGISYDLIEFAFSWEKRTKARQENKTHT